MLYIVDSGIDNVHVKNYVLYYKDKFGVNFFSLREIDHFISWLHNEILIGHFNISRNSDELRYKRGERPCSGINDEEFEHIMCLIDIELEKAGTILNVDNLHKFTESLDSILKCIYADKFREIMHEIVDELLSDNITEIDCRHSIRDLCNTIQDRIEYRVDLR